MINWCSKISKLVEGWLEGSDCQSCAKGLFESPHIHRVFKKASGKLYRGIVLSGEFNPNLENYSSWSKSKDVAISFLTDKKYKTHNKDGDMYIITINASDVDVIDLYSMGILCGGDGIDELAYDSLLKEKEVILSPQTLVNFKLTKI
jgi:hypothetical protein